jgi:hypothetical protein
MTFTDAADGTKFLDTESHLTGQGSEETAKHPATLDHDFSKLGSLFIRIIILFIHLINI